MFFNMDLLCRQRKGKFALIWLASTKGLKEVTKLEIEKANISRICDEILKYVMSNSTSPSRRLSLYLAAKLMWGTVVLYQQQIKFFESDAIFFSVCISRRPYKFELDEDKAKPKLKQPRKPRKSKKDDPAQQLQILENQMLQTLPDVAANVTDVIHITLRDEISTRINLNEQELFGDEGQLDQQLAQLEDLNWLRPPPPEPHPIPHTTDATPVDPLDKRQITSVEDVEQSPSKRRRIGGEHLFPVVRVQETGSLSPATPRRMMPPPVTPTREMPPPMSPRVARSRTTLTAAEIQENLQQPPSTPPPRVRTTRRRLSMEYSVLTPSRWHRETIYRVDRQVFGAREGSQISLSPRDVDPKAIIAEILRGLPYCDEDIISVVRDINENLSLNCEIPTLRTAFEKQQQTLDPVPRPELTVHTEPNIRLLDLETLPEVPLVPSPRLSRISMGLHPHLEIKPEPAEISELPDLDQHPPRIHTSTPVTLETEAKRHSALLQNIRERFLENGYQPLTLEELCHPLNRVMVARTFHALLHLHSQQYVQMEKDDNSLSLKQICPGPRI